MTWGGAAGRETPRRAKGLLDAIEASFADTLRSPEGTTTPAALLWTDEESQWARALDRLRAALLGPPSRSGLRESSRA